MFMFQENTMGSTTVTYFIDVYVPSKYNGTKPPWTTSQQDVQQTVWAQDRRAHPYAACHGGYPRGGPISRDGLDSALSKPKGARAPEPAAGGRERAPISVLGVCRCRWWLIGIAAESSAQEALSKNTLENNV